MAKSKRSKAYRPRPVSATGGLFAIQKALDDTAQHKSLDDDQLADLSIAFRIAFQNMLTGGADEQQWSICVCSLNIALILAESGIGAEFEGVINKALEGAFRTKIRAGRTGSWVLDGDAQQAIKAAFEVHEAQLLIATRAELKGAIFEVRRRIDSGDVFKEAA